MKNRTSQDKETEEALFDFCYTCFLRETFLRNVYDISHNGASNSEKLKLAV